MLFGDSGASVQMEQSWNADGRVAWGSIATDSFAHVLPRGWAAHPREWRGSENAFDKMKHLRSRAHRRDRAGSIPRGKEVARRDRVVRQRIHLHALSALQDWLFTASSKHCASAFE